MARRRKEQRMGFVDLCRISEDGKVRCNAEERSKMLFGKPRWLPLDEDKWECVNDDWDPTKLTKKGKQSHAITACRADGPVPLKLVQTATAASKKELKEIERRFPTPKTVPVPGEAEE